MSTQEVDLEDGWATLEILIYKLIDRVEGGLKPYSGDEVLDAHRIIYKLCNQKLPHDNDEFLYNKYKDSLSEYINEGVLPLLKDEHNECLLKELTEWWPKYLSVVECISCLFDYLDELITVTRSLPSLKIVGVTCFFSLVYTEIHATVKDAVLALIENDSHVVANGALLKNCMDFFAEMKSVDTDRSYSWDLETTLLSKRVEYHRKISSTYISTIEFPEYILMAEKYLNEEDGWASCLLKQSNYFALMKNLRQMWLRQCESEKLKSYFSSLVLNERMEDLKRLYDLFGPHKGLESIKLLFKQYVDETMATLRAEDSNRHRILSVIYDRHEMYSQLIEECFGDDLDLQKVLNECLDYGDDAWSLSSVNQQRQVPDPTASVFNPEDDESVTSRLQSH